MMMNSPSSKTCLLHTGGRSASRLASIQSRKLKAVRGFMRLSRCGLARVSSCTSEGRDAFQLYGDGRRQPIHLDGGPAGTLAREVVPIDSIESVEVAFDVGQEDGDVDQPVPAGACGLEHALHVTEYGVALGLDVVVHHAALVVPAQPGYVAAGRVPRAQSGQEQQPPGPAGVGIRAYRRRRRARADGPVVGFHTGILARLAAAF